MRKFEKEKSYRLGVLKADEDQASPDPQFTSKPTSIVLTGQQLVNSGFKTLDDYLGHPEIPFSDKKVVHCYEIEDTGLMSYFGSQTPLPRPQQALHDNANSMFPMGLGNSGNAEYFRDEITRKNKEITELRARVEADQNKYLAEKSEWLEKDSDQKFKIVKLETELKAFKEMLEGMKEGQALNDNGGGMGGKVMDFLNGPIGHLASSLAANNPKVQDALSNLIVRFDSQISGAGVKPSGGLNQPTETINGGVDQV